MSDAKTLMAAVEAANEIRRLRQRLDWLEGMAIPHARRQENANGFQKGWHAALSRIGVDSVDVLSVLVPQPCADVDDTLPWPLNMPAWKCRACGCLWRDNLDNTVSLLNAEQKSCPSCEHSPTREACAIHWLPMELATPMDARFTPVDEGKANGSATDRTSSLQSPPRSEPR